MKKDLGAKELIFPTPVLIIGSYNENGVPNAMNAAWAGVCSSEPPCVAVSIRPERQTYENIKNKEAFTVNIPGEKHMKEADYFGIVSGKKADKFKATGLTAAKSEKVDAPYIEEFPINLECKVYDTMEIGSHVHFIGEIVNVKADESCLNEKGMPDVKKAKPMTFDTATSDYNAIGEVVGKAFSAGVELMKK